MTKLTKSEIVFNSIKFQFNPKHSFEYMIDELFGLGSRPSNFSGGCGDLRTTHEKMFSLLYPDLRQQVVFGTGKGGYEKYGFKRIIVDFYDEKEKIAYEVDGKNHKNEIRCLKDRIRSSFLWLEHGVRVGRITNEEVEGMLLKRLQELEEAGVLDAYIN
jgi:very-short-patch-repair endonuclease